MAQNLPAPKPDNEEERSYGWQPEVFPGGGEGSGAREGDLHTVGADDRQTADPERAFGARGNQGQSTDAPRTVTSLERAGANQQHSFHKPGQNSGKQRVASRIKGVFKKKKNLVGGGLVGLLVGGGFLGFTILQGPLQFIHISQVLSGFHFGPVDDFGDGRSGKFMLYSLSGKAARGRLGVNGNRRADIWETRLNENGLRSIYQSGTQRGIGYEVTDPGRAKPFLDDMRRQGIDIDTNLTRAAVDIDGNKVPRGVTGVFPEDGDFRQMNRVTRSAVKSLGVNKVRSSSAARLLIRRTGTNGLFHPFRNAVRRQADSYAVWREDRREADRNRYVTGDPDLNPADTRLGRLRSRIGTSLRTARGPAIVVAATCGLKTFSDSIDEQNYQNQLTMMRMGTSTVAKGSQVKSMQDLNLEAMGVASEHFYSEETETSWLDDPGVQHELGNTPTGTDYLAENDIKPGSKEKPAFFRVADRVPNVLNVCGLLNSAGEIISDLPVISQINGIIDRSARAVSGKSPEEWVATARDYFANGGVNALAEGAEWGGLVNTGTRLAANDTMLASGGRELSDQEALAVKSSARNTRQRQFASTGIFNRYFNIFESRSLTAQLFQHSPKNGRQLSTGLAQLPAATFTNFLPSFVRDQTAHAATGYEYGFPVYGFSIEEQNDPKYEDPFANAAYIETGDRLQELNEEYGRECFGMTIGSNGELQYQDALDITEIDDAKCSGENLQGQAREAYMRYRFYLADMITVHTLDCYEGLSDDSCAQLGFGGETASQSAAAGSSIIGDPDAPSADIACAPGTKDLGTDTPAYSNGRQIPTRLCEITEFDNIGNSGAPGYVPGSTGGVIVNSRVSGAWSALYEAAKDDGVTLVANSAFRTMEHQEQVWRDNGMDTAVVAPPGNSKHQSGHAIDFANVGGKKRGATCETRNRQTGSEMWVWLEANARDYGFKVYSVEPWHWDALDAGNRC